MSISSNGSTVGVATKLAYGVGGLSDALKTFSFTTFLLFYYTTVLGLPGTWLGIAMAVGLVWDAVVDPLIGHASDHATIAFGRRHSFMLVGSVVAGASFIAVFNPPAGLSTKALFAWLMVSSLCLRSSNSVFMVPYYALGSELATDYHERTSISGYRAGAVLVGTLVATAAAFLIYLPDGAPGIDAKFAPGSYASIGVAFGVSMTIIGLVATLGTLHERRRLTSAVTASSGRAWSVPRVVLTTLADRSFRVLVIAGALSVMAATMNAALSMHFLTYRARVGANQGMTWYYGGFYMGALAGVFVWVRVTHWIEKHRVYAAASFLTAFVVSSGYWLIGDGRPLGTGQVSVLVAFNCLVGFFGIAGAVIVPSMMADITAQDEYQTGNRRDGTYFGIYSFSQQIATGLAVLIAAVLVDRSAGLVPAQVEQSPTTIDRIAMVSNLLPAMLLAAAGVAVLRYRLTRQEIQAGPHKLAASTEPPRVPA